MEKMENWYLRSAISKFACLFAPCYYIILKRWSCNTLTYALQCTIGNKPGPGEPWTPFLFLLPRRSLLRQPFTTKGESHDLFDWFSCFSLVTLFVDGWWDKIISNVEMLLYLFFVHFCAIHWQDIKLHFFSHRSYFLHICIYVRGVSCSDYLGFSWKCRLDLG